MSDAKLVRRALLAVYDKGGVVDLARALVELGVELVSSRRNRGHARARPACR